MVSAGVAKRSKRDLAIERRLWEHSTGPRTPEGKMRCRLNKLKHGARRLWVRAIPAYANSVQALLQELEQSEQQQK